MNKVFSKALAAATVGLLTVPLALISHSNLSASQPTEDKPNIVLILTDDQDYASMPVMRNLENRPEGSWVNFTNAYVNLSVCCPSRASILTGRYAHNHGVIGNDYCEELNDRNTLPVWLDDAGYETALIGKYLNNELDGYEPPGWDVFRDIEYKNVEDILSNHAVDFLEQTTGPFFLYLAYGAPHRDATPPDRYLNVDAYVPPDHPSFNEADLTDKPIKRALLTPAEIALNRTERLNAQRELMAVDDGVQRVIDTLKAKGELDNTMIIYLSDHGYSWGDHRSYGKLCPYDECAQVPLMIRYPDGGNNRDETRFASNVDMAWTIAEYAGVIPPLSQDGRSLLPLLNHSTIDWTNEVLLERHLPRFYGIRTEQWKYIEHQSGPAKGKEELYDLVNDPFELENLAGKVAYKIIQADLAARLKTLRTRPSVLPSQATPTPTATSASTPVPTNTPVSTPVSTPTSTAVPGPSPTPVPTATPNPSGGSVTLISLAADAVVGGTKYADEDIIAYDSGTGQWSLLFDGSSFGLATLDIDAFHNNDGEFLLISLDKPKNLPPLGVVDDSDIIKFVPDTPGDFTAGHFETYFDGSAAELTTAGEDIDALSLLPDGRLLISLLVDSAKITINGSAVVPKDEDILVFLGQTGNTTAGTWDWYLRGSAIGLSTNAEDVDGIGVSGAEDAVYLSTLGNFKLTSGLKGGGSDIFVCYPTGFGSNRTCDGGLGLFLKGSQIGLGAGKMDAIQVVVP